MEIATASASNYAADPPIADGRRVLVAGVVNRTRDAPGEASVHAIDAVDGRTIWRTSLPTDPGVREIRTSLPLPRADGGIWLVAHQFDVCTVIHGVDAAGRIDARIDLPRDGELGPMFDHGSKLGVRLALAGTNFLFSWAYRERETGIIAYSHDGRVRWQAAEWLLACDGTTAISCPDGGPRPEADKTWPFARALMTLVARDAANGNVLWQLDVEDVTVAALAAGTLHLADRGPMLRDVRAQFEAVDTRYLAGEIEESALEAAWNACTPRVPMNVRALDVRTGRECGSFEGGAQLLGVVAKEGAIAALAREHDGALQLRIREVADIIIERKEPTFDPTIQPLERAAIIADDDTIVVLTKEKWCAFDWKGVARAEGTSPTPAFACEPRRLDRWLTVASATLAAGRLVVRDHATVTIVDPRR